MTGEREFQERCLTKLGVDFTGRERTIDVGCGDGAVARILRERVGELVAVDVEPFASWDSGVDGLEFMVANGEKLPFEDASFDLVHSKDSLHHMKDPAAAMREYRRVLKPGGLALITEGNRYNPIFYVHMTRMLGHEHFPQRVFRRLVRDVFPDARFTTFEAHYVPGAPPSFRHFQRLVEDTLEHLPGVSRFVSYNVAVVRMGGS